jgi:hypothetical protein
MAIRSDIKHFAPKTSSHNGIYRGVVEDNNDPEKLGRCKVRVWGLHDELKDQHQKEGIPTDVLPWAEPCLGLVEGSMSGFGMFSVPLQGSHVFCFFENGNWESLRYFATAPGKPVDAPDSSKGFNDPDGVYPRNDRLNESDFHRLSRGVSGGTIVEHKNNNLDLGIEKSTGETWDEPESAYAAEYPHNIVLTTHKGITIEIDNTDGSERVHIFHPSNTYIEIDAQGNVVFRNEGDRFMITKGDENKHVFGNENETIDIDKTKYIKGEETIKVDVDRTTTIGNNEVEDIGNNETRTVGQNCKETIGSNWNVSVGGDITIEAGGNITIKGARIDLNP